MEGIRNVVQGDGWVRIEIDNEFYVALHREGAIFGRSNGTEQDDHAHVDPEAAGQIARTILSWPFAADTKEDA